MGDATVIPDNFWKPNYTLSIFWFRSLSTNKYFGTYLHNLTYLNMDNYDNQVIKLLRRLISVTLIHLNKAHLHLRQS